MDIQIQGHHIDITEGLTTHIHEKFAKLEKHFDHIVHASAILTVEKNIHKVEATVKQSHTEAVATAESDDMYASIDAVVEKINKQLQKSKEKSLAQKRSVQKATGS